MYCIKLLFFLIIVGLHQNAFSKVPYLAIAGAGQGAGMMGHAFLVFADTQGQFLSANAYQYAVEFPENFDFSIKNLPSLSQLPFVVDKLPAWFFIKQYNQEGRYVHLFELALSQAQTETLQHLIEDDMNRRASLTVRDYSVDSNNCLTKIYDAINSVISDEVFRFRFSSPVTAMYDFSFIRPGRISASIPLAASMALEKHPLVREVIKFRSSMVIELENNLEVLNQNSELFSKCRISESTKNLFLDVFSNKKLRETPAYLDLFKNLFSSCAKKDPSLVDSYNFHLDYIRYQSADVHFIEIADAYYIH